MSLSDSSGKRSLALLAAAFLVLVPFHTLNANAATSDWTVTFTFKETAKGVQQGYSYKVDHDAMGKATLKVSSDGKITGSGTGTTKAFATAYTEFGECTGSGTYSAKFSVDGKFDKSTNKAEIRLFDVNPKSVFQKINCPDGNAGQGDLFMPFDTCGKYIALTLASGKQQKGTFAASKSQCSEDITNSWTATPTGSEAKVSIVITKSELNLLTDTKTTVTVKVMNSDGSAAKDTEVKIKVCTAVGNEKTDGHSHDARKDKCDLGRPSGTIEDAKKPGKASNQLSAITDQNGFVNLTYKPAMDGSKKYIIAGQDFIIAEVGESKAEGSITTKVPGLKQMAGSEGCKGGTGYSFEKQASHGCIFYGTPDTDQSMATIANAFLKKQAECKIGCTIKADNGTSIKIRLIGAPTPLKITAMNLPWGGLSDIGGKWAAPHQSHKSGKEVDIGLANLGGCKNGSPSNLVLVLRGVILQNGNFGKWGLAEEGGDMKKTCTSSAPHFHIDFKK